jgi:hypothetical protein
LLSLSSRAAETARDLSVARTATAKHNASIDRKSSLSRESD